MVEEAEGEEHSDFPKEVHSLLVGAQAAHVQLSAMADSKASILMGATFVVFSLVIGQSTPALMSVPMMVLGISSFAAAVLSVLAILPSVPRKTKVKSPNLLFFGHFTHLPEDAFVDAMIDAMKSEETVYRMLARDLYQNGQVLQRRKYRYLAYAYRVFLFGLIATVLSFIVERLAGW